MRALKEIQQHEFELRRDRGRELESQGMPLCEIASRVGVKVKHALEIPLPNRSDPRLALKLHGGGTSEINALQKRRSSRSFGIGQRVRC